MTPAHPTGAPRTRHTAAAVGRNPPLWTVRWRLVDVALEHQGTRALGRQVCTALDWAAGTDPPRTTQTRKDSTE